MSKIKFLSTVSLALLGINLFLVWFLLSHRPPNGRPQEPKQVIIEKLGFDDTQIEAYLNLIKQHRELSSTIDTDIKGLKTKLYATLKQENQQKITDSLTAEIGKLQVEIEKINYMHFQEIKAICKPDQLPQFNAFCDEITDIFNQKRMPPHEKR